MMHRYITTVCLYLFAIIWAGLGFWGLTLWQKAAITMTASNANILFVQMSLIWLVLGLLFVAVVGELK